MLILHLTPFLATGSFELGEELFGEKATVCDDGWI